MGVNIGTVIAMIKALAAKIDPSTVEQSVSDWLDDHPEATTTVEDGSITKAKLDSNLQDAVDDVSQLKSAISDKNNIIIPTEDFRNAVDNDMYDVSTATYQTFVQGTRNGSGISATSDTRIRTGLENYGLTKRYKIVPKSGYKIRIFYYRTTSTTTFERFTDYFTDEYVTDFGHCISIVVGKTDDSEIVPADAPNAFDMYRLIPVVETLESRLEPLEESKKQVDLLDIVNAEPIYYKIGSTSAFIKASDGTAGSSNNYERTDFVNISGYDYLIYSRLKLTVDSTTGGIAFYTSANTDGFIANSGEYCIVGAEAEGYTESIVKIPATANYVRLTLKKSVSGFYVKGIRSNPLKGMKLSILGDSISTFNGEIPSGNQTYYTGSNDGIASANEIWWKVLCNNTGMIPLVMDAWSGSSVCYNYATDSTHSDTNKIPMCSDLRTGRLSSNGENPDIIIVAGGTNDWTYSESTTTPLGNWNGRTAVSRSDVVSGQSTFMESYASMIAKLHENYPNAIIVCASCFFTCRGTDLGITRVNDMGYTESDYSDAIERVCKIMGVPFIDIYNVGFTFDNYYSTYAIDSSTEATHPNAKGHAVIAKRMIEELPKIVRQFTK